LGYVGACPEIHEKINPENGRGALVVFSTQAGRYSHVSTGRTARSIWSSGGGFKIRKDKAGRAVLEMDFKIPGVKIIFFS
jgi:hypothetical protein